MNLDTLSCTSVVVLSGERRRTRRSRFGRELQGYQGQCPWLVGRRLWNCHAQTPLPALDFVGRNVFVVVQIQNWNECIVRWIYQLSKPKHGTEFIICGRLCDPVLATHLNKIEMMSRTFQNRLACFAN